jgi:hypothetical protein
VIQLVDVNPWGTFGFSGADVQSKRQRLALVSNHDPHAAKCHAHRISDNASRQSKKRKHQVSSAQESVEEML